MLSDLKTDMVHNASCFVLGRASDTAVGHELLLSQVAPGGDHLLHLRRQPFERLRVLALALQVVAQLAA